MRTRDTGNMALQLVLRKYLDVAKMQYKKLGVRSPERMAYGISSDVDSPCNLQFFKWILYTGELNLLMDLTREIGRKVELPEGISMKQRFLIMPVEQYPGLIDSLLLLTPEKVLTVRFKGLNARSGPPQVYLKARLSERHTHFNFLNDAFTEGKRLCMLGLKGTVTCSPK